MYKIHRLWRFVSGYVWFVLQKIVPVVHWYTGPRGTSPWVSWNAWRIGRLEAIAEGGGGSLPSWRRGGGTWVVRGWVGDGEGGTGKSDPGPGAATSVTANKGDFLEFSVRGGQSTPPQGTIAPPEDSLHRAQVTRQLCHHETIATTWTTLTNHHRWRCPKMFAFVLLFYLATCPHCHILELSTFCDPPFHTQFWRFSQKYRILPSWEI